MTPLDVICWVGAYALAVVMVVIVVYIIASVILGLRKDAAEQRRRNASRY